MTGVQPLAFSSNWDSVGEQSAGKPRSSRQWLSLHVKQNIKVWLELFKKPPSWDQWCVKWATSRCRQQWLEKTTKAASNWLPTLWCTNDQKISIRIITSYTRKSWWQLSATGLHANSSTGSRSVDEITSTSESGETPQATIGPIAVSSSRQRNNLSKGVAEKNLVEFLEPQNLNFCITIAQNREETDLLDVTANFM